MVGHRPLKARVGVRIPVPQSFDSVASLPRSGQVPLPSRRMSSEQSESRHIMFSARPRSGLRPSFESKDVEGESRFMYYVYILECANKALYTGITTDIDRRFARHRAGEGGRYTSYNQPVRIRYSEEHPDRSSASKREAQIKRWSRTKKLALIKEDRGIIKAAFSD